METRNCFVCNCEANNTTTGNIPFLVCESCKAKTEVITAGRNIDALRNEPDTRHIQKEEIDDFAWGYADATTEFPPMCGNDTKKRNRVEYLAGYIKGIEDGREHANA